MEKIKKYIAWAHGLEETDEILLLSLRHNVHHTGVCKDQRKKVSVFVLLYCSAIKLSTDEDDREKVLVFVLLY